MPVIEIESVLVYNILVMQFKMRGLCEQSVCIYFLGKPGHENGTHLRTQGIQIPAINQRN